MSSKVVRHFISLSFLLKGAVRLLLFDVRQYTVGSLILNSFLYGVFISTVFFCFHVSKVAICTPRTKASPSPLRQWQHEKRVLEGELYQTRMRLQGETARLNELQEASNRVVLAPTTLEHLLQNKSRTPSFQVL